MKQWGDVDDESERSTQQDDVTSVGRGESEIERVGWRWRIEAESWFQEQGEGYQKERSVIHNEDEVGGRPKVTRDEQRVLRGDWAVMSWCRYEDWWLWKLYMWVSGVCIGCVQLLWESDEMSSMTGFRSLDSSTRKRLLDLLEAVYLGLDIETISVFKRRNDKVVSTNSAV